jgi:VanZ family protein
VKNLSPAVRALLAWFPVFAYTALIWWLSSQALQVPLIERFPLQDKGVHFLEYGAMSLFITHALVITFRDGGPRAVVMATLMTVALGFLDELHQAFVPGRSSDAMDLLADSIGAVVFSTIYVVGLRLIRGRERTSAPERLRTSEPPLSGG